MSISKKLIIGAAAIAVAGGVAARMTVFNEGEGPAGEGVKIVTPAGSATAKEAGEGSEHKAKEAGEGSEHKAKEAGEGSKH